MSIYVTLPQESTTKLSPSQYLRQMRSQIFV